MAHFAEIDENNIVIRVVVTDNDMPNEGYDWLVESFGGRWIQTSYNSTIRGRFAGAGMQYLEDEDVFVPRKLFASWLYSEEILDWVAPIPYPDDGIMYQWNETDQDWEAIDFTE